MGRMAVLPGQLRRTGSDRLLIRNNDRIDFAALELRLSAELAKLAVASRHQRAGQGPVEAERSDAPGSQGHIMTAISERMQSLLASLSHILWAVSHFPTLIRRGISGYYAAEFAQSHVQQLEAHVEQLEAHVERLETLVELLKTRISATEAATTTLARSIGSLRALISARERAAAALAQPLGNPVPCSDGQMAPAAASSQTLDLLYADLEDVFRGSREDIMQRVVSYADWLIDAGAGQPDTPVLDIGCGRGEWLEVLRTKGLAAYGIDTNAVAVERSVALGLDARQADLIIHLHGLGDASRSAITAFHVVEHLPLDTIVEFLDEAFRVLVPGGVLILETPNPETMKVGATTFHNDPTHRSPLVPAVLQFVVEHRGFVNPEILRLRPFTQGLLQENTNDAQLLNRALFGPQDYTIIARKP